MKRRICLITDSLDRRRGGAEGYLADLAESFVQAGHPVRALLRRAGGNLPSVETEIVPARIGWSLGRDWEFARSINRRLAGTGDVVFSSLPVVIPEATHYWSPAGLYRTGFEAERASFDPGWRRRFYRFGNCLNLQRQQRMAAQEKLLARRPPMQIFTFSSAAREQMLQLRNPPLAENVTVHPPGVDLSRFRPGSAASQPAGKLRLLFVGHNFRLKGLHCLLRALSTALRDGLQADLLVAGSGENSEFRALAARLGVSAKVTFLGAVSDVTMSERFQSSDVLVHPTFADHCSLVALEALASGVPVITTRHNGASELMESGREAFIIEDPRDSEALAVALLKLKDRKRLSKMRAAAVVMRPRLDFQAHARRVLSWLTGD